MLDVQVLVIGGGPVGLALACELGWRGVKCLLVEKNDGINQHPRANVVASRSMEHLRRWGIAERIARAGLPLDYPVEIVFTTRINAIEIFRFSFPSYEQCERPSPELLAKMPELGLSPYFKGSIGQNHFEPLLLAQASTHPTNVLRFGTRLLSFTQDADGVLATLQQGASGRIETVRADDLVACDGGRSQVRTELAISMCGKPDLGRFVGIYFRSQRFAKAHRLGRATLYWAMNPASPGVFIAIDGSDHFTFQRALRPGEEAGDLDPRATIDQAFGAALDAEIISVQPWRAHATVADHYRVKRVFLAGDAAHLFVPTGGFGMNTGIGDAVDLGWKLAGRLAGWGADGLLDAYEAERKPLAERNTGYARRFADSVGLFIAKPELDEDSGRGEAERRIASDHLNRHARLEFDIPGVTFGGRYDGSPIIVGDGAALPPDEPNRYVPTASPGGRPPHAWLDDGRSLFDLFHAEWTLLALGPDAPSTVAFENAASAAAVDLRIVRLAQRSLCDLYEAPLALIRPDQIVAWRGDSADGAAGVLARVMGR